MNPFARLRRPVHVATIAAIVAATLAVGVLQPTWRGDLANFVFDTFQRLDPAEPTPDGPVRVVAIDEASLAARGQWPWPRTLVAELTTKLAEAGAAAIAFDVVFAEPDRLDLTQIAATLPDGADRTALARLGAARPNNDARFADALAHAPSLLAATFLSQAPATARPALAPKAGFASAGDPPEPHLPLFAGLTAPLDALAAAAPGLGATNWLPDHDQIVRRIPLVMRTREIMLPSLALEALRIAQGAPSVLIRSTGAAGETAFGRGGGINAVRVGEVTVATDAHGAVRPHYRPVDPARWLSAESILAGTVPAHEIAGRIVFVGTTAVGLGDIRATPLDASVPGVEMHAQTVEGILDGRLLVRPDWAAGAETLLALALVVLVGALLPLIPPFAAAGLGAALLAALLAASLWAFRSRSLLVDPAFPALALVATHLFGALAVWRSEQQTRRTIHAAFGKFLSPAVVDRLAEHPERLVLGGETRELTVMFTDLRGFTALSEGLDASELTAFMNDYLTPMTDAVLETDGTVDKYIGDAVVAFWNAPLDDPDHTPHAVAAALRMRAELVGFAARRAEIDTRAGRPIRDIRMGVGIARGPCSVGNMGSSRRFDYSILGDTANLASRLEGLSKLYRVDIVATGDARAAAPDVAWIELDRVRVHGREAVTTLFTPVGDAAMAASPEFQAWNTAHARLLAAWRNARFVDALGEARALATTVEPEWRGYYDDFIGRIETMVATPPGPDWSPIRRLDVK